MIKIGIWGTGGMSVGLSQAFDLDKVEIVFYIDNDSEKQGKEFNNIKVIAPYELKDKQFDYIFISTQKYEIDILRQIKGLGIGKDKVISASINVMEMSKIYNLFTEKGLIYLTYLSTNANIDAKLKKQEKRYANLFLKQKYENDAAKFIIDSFIEGENAPGRNVIFEDRKEYYDYILEKVNKKKGLYLEFGVNAGGSINYLSQFIGDNVIYGFDSFEGLPEGWLPGFQKGMFNNNGNLPVVNKNVKLVKGWFDETLPEFIKEHKDEKCVLINIDCDLYSSAKCVLSLLKDHIVKGTIIMFDEFVGQIGWQNDEYKAFFEFINETCHNFRYIACAFGGGHQLTERVAIEII